MNPEIITVDFTTALRSCPFCAESPSLTYTLLQRTQPVRMAASHLCCGGMEQPRANE